MTPPNPKPAILIINSGILPSATDILSLQTFHTWYDKFHIPDLFNLTDGVKSAFRYEALPSKTSSGSSSDKQPLPFIAIYPSEDINFFAAQDSPIWRVPTSHPMLPGERGNIFALAEFGMGLFEKVVQVQIHSSFAAGHPPAQKFLALVGIDAREVEGTGDDGAKPALEDSVPVAATAKEGARPVRSTLFKWVECSPPGAPKVEGTEEQVGTPFTGFKAYMAVHEYNEVPGGKLTGKDSGPVFAFSSLGSFGDVTKAW